MIVRLSGTLLEVNAESVILERDGIAREVLIPGYAADELSDRQGREVTLHTLEWIEGVQPAAYLTPRLVGFVYPEDRSFFSQFISVKGIGARKALKALVEPVGRIAGWIEKGDRKALATLPGIGARAAEMIVAELKGKLEGLVTGDAPAIPIESRADLNAAQQDALMVMTACGDSRSDAVRWLERTAQLHADLESTEDWVRAAYRVKAGLDR